MNKSHFTGKKLKISLIFFILCSLQYMLPEQNAHSAPKKKKLYISSIKANNLPAALADQVRNGITLAILNNYRDQYQVLDDEGIKVMYAQAAAIMASGCDDVSCVTQIADGINADEIIYGNVTPHRSKIKINLTNLERKGVSLEIKSKITESVYESRLDYAAAECAKKLVDPKYKIDMSNAPAVQEQVTFGGIRIKSVESLEVSVIEFRSDDETVSRITNYLKSLVSEGDSYFKKKKYSEARDKYLEIIEKVRTKLSQEKQSLVKEYVDGIHKRIDSTYIMEFKPRIDTIDTLLNRLTKPDEEEMEEGLEKYRSVEEDVKRIKDPYNESRDQLLSAINERKDSIHFAILAGREKKGDIYYRDYKFVDAMNWYRKAKDSTNYISNSEKKSGAIERINSKINTTQSTGEGYLVNRVKSLVDQAEFYNFQDKLSSSEDTMDDARDLITGSHRIFVTQQAIDIFNNFARVLKIDPIVSDAERSMREREETAAEQRERELSRRDAAIREEDITSKSSFIRLGYGGFGLVNLADSDLNKYYENGQAFMGECYFMKFRDFDGNGFDFFGRYMYRSFEMTDDTFEEFMSDPPGLDSDEIRTYPLSKSDLTLHSLDIGVRYSIGAFFLFERWDVYLSGAFRILHAIEEAESGLTNKFWTTGAIGGAGIEVSIIAHAGLFVEVQTGYTPAGESKRNVDGMQVLFGATYRTEFQQNT